MQSSSTQHPGAYIRQYVIPGGLSITAAAKQLGIGRPALSNVLNGNASLSSEMALRLGKAFGVDHQPLLAMQANWDQAVLRAREPGIAVRTYAPRYLAIKAIQIEAWADRLETRAELPALLRKLVTSTGKELSHVDFPAYENSQRPGWDGQVTTGSATPWIPLGISGWEFGVNADPADKAQGDYRARTKSVPPEARAATSFVFVTPRNWPGKASWVSAKRVAAEWKDVRAYDASDLEQWLEVSIPAQIWLGESLPVGALGTQSLNLCWKQWANVTEPPLSKGLFRATAESGGNKLLAWLGSPAERPFTVVADSDEEALAALACVFESEPLRESHAGDRVVVIRSADALSRVEATSSDCIVVLASKEAQSMSAGLHRTNHTIVVTRRNAFDDPPDMSVDLVDDSTFHEALTEMGFCVGEIERLGRESGQSQTVLRRRMTNVDAIKTPPWAANKDIAKHLVPLMFVGAWSSGMDADQVVVSNVAARSYDLVEQSIAELRGEEQSPVWSEGEFRGVISKTDAFYAVHELVTSSDLQRFFEIAHVVLAESDPGLELPEDKRWASNLYGKSRKHSSALRSGLCETLVLLAVHGDKLFKGRLGFDVEGRVNALIHKLLTPVGPATWRSQQDDLPRYAEAAPDVFLDILEQDLRSGEPKVHALFKPADSSLFSSPGRTGLLWALEGLAWNPRWLFRVVRVLAQFAILKIDDNWVNKPAHSLAAIFRCWMPQTAATIDQRLEALDVLVEGWPEAGWRICLDQFDPNATIGNHSSRPRWRRDAAGAGEPVTTLEAHQMARRALDLALAWTPHDDRTLGDLVERLHGFPDDHDALWAAVQTWLATSPDDALRAALRERIRRSTMTVPGRHRNGGGASTAARDAFDSLVPRNLVMRHHWLFAQNWVQESADEIEAEDLDYEKREERIGLLRHVALDEIWRSTGLDGVARLCELSEAPWIIGWTLAGILGDGDAKTFITDVIKRGNGEASRKLDDCVKGLLAKLGGPVRGAILGSLMRTFLLEGQGATRVVRLLLCAPFDAETWDLVASLPKRSVQAYWKVVSPSRFFRHHADDANRAIDELLQVDRPRAAFNMVEMAFAQVTSERLVRLLVEAATNGSEPTGQYLLAPHNISNAFKELSRRPASDVPEGELARLEFFYVDALSHTEHGIRNLERQLSRTPSLFLQVLAFAFKRDDDLQDPPELRANNQQAAASLASTAYGLLSRAKRLPGSNDNGVVDRVKLREWMAEVRTLTRQHARESVGDSLIGQLLARSPEGGDGLWPSEPVREILEDFGTAQMASGMITGRYNARGAVYRSDDGGEERQLARSYQEAASRLASRFPFTSRMLEGLVSMYDRDAAWHDTRGRTRKRLRH